MCLHTFHSLLAFSSEHVVSCKVTVFYHILHKLVPWSRMVSKMSDGVIPPTPFPVTKVVICFLHCFRWSCGFCHLQANTQHLVRACNAYSWAHAWKLSPHGLSFSFMFTPCSKSSKDFSASDYIADNTYPATYCSFSFFSSFLEWYSSCQLSIIALNRLHILFQCVFRLLNNLYFAFMAFQGGDHAFIMVDSHF